MFVLGLASSVFAADIRLGGDAYVVGVWTNNYDLSDDGRDDSRYWAERVVLKLDAVLENGIELRTAFDVVGDINGPNYWGHDFNNYPGKPSTSDNSFDTVQSVESEYAYLHVPIGAVVVDAGHMLTSWGDGFDSFETPADRVKLTYKVNDMVTLSGYVRKDWERLSSDYGKGDMNTYNVVVEVTPNDSTKAGLGVYFTQDEEDYTVHRFVIWEGIGDGPYHLGDTWKFDGYVNTKVGPVAIMSEMVYKTANKQYDMTEGLSSGERKKQSINQFGGFILAQGNVAPVTLTGAFAWASNLYSADNDFQPTLLFGTRNNPVAFMDFQSMANDRTTWAALGAVDFKPNDATTLHGLIAYASVGDPGKKAKALDLVELDATMKYQISKSTAYTIGATVGLPSNVPSDMFDGNDDVIFGAFHKLSISF